MASYNEPSSADSFWIAGAVWCLAFIGAVSGTLWFLTEVEFRLGRGTSSYVAQNQRFQWASEKIRGFSKDYRGRIVFLTRGVYVLLSLPWWIVVGFSLCIISWVDPELVGLGILLLFGAVLNTSFGFKMWAARNWRLAVVPVPVCVLAWMR